MIMIDIDMPDNCDECRFNTEYSFCKAMPDNFCGNTDDRKRPEWCPLKEQKEKPLLCDKCSYHREDGWCGMHGRWVNETDYCSFGAWEGR